MTLDDLDLEQALREHALALRHLAQGQADLQACDGDDGRRRVLEASARLAKAHLGVLEAVLARKALRGPRAARRLEVVR